MTTNGKKRHLTNGVIVDRMIASHEAEKEEIAVGWFDFESRVKARHKKRRGELLKLADPQRHKAILAGVDAMLGVLHPVVPETVEDDDAEV